MENLGLILSIAGAVLAVFLGGMGSSMGINKAGEKAAGVLAEKPNLFGSLLILTALPGSQGIYGLLISIIILLQVGVLGGADVVVSTSAGWAFLLSGLVMGLCALTSAVLQGKVVAAAIGAVARDESVAGKSITLSVLIETYAIFGLLIAMFIALGAL